MHALSQDTKKCKFTYVNNWKSNENKWDIFLCSLNYIEKCGLKVRAPEEVLMCSVPQFKETYKLIKAYSIKDYLPGFKWFNNHTQFVLCTWPSIKYVFEKN